MLIDFLDRELGTSDITRADSYLEDPLRLLVHLIMSQPGVPAQLSADGADVPSKSGNSDERVPRDHGIARRDWPGPA